MALSELARGRIDQAVAKYPADQKQSAVMAALAIVQDERGWLSVETMDEVADYLGMPPVAVYEVASFYAMYNVKPTGRFKLTICTNLPCALQGATEAAQHLKAKLGIGFNETTGDGKFTLKEGECMGACGDAPVVLVNNKRMCVNMIPPALDAVLADLSAAADRGEGAPGAPGVAGERGAIGGGGARDAQGTATPDRVTPMQPAPGAGAAHTASDR